MSDVKRVDMGSQAEASSSSKRDMGSYISIMKPSDVKALTRKYKIPRDLHPVAVSSKWTMDRLTDEYIGLYEQYFEFAVQGGLLFSAGLAITWEFPKFRPLFKYPEGNVVTMSEYLRLPFLSGMTIEAGEALTEQNVIPQHTTTPLSADEQVPDKTDSQQRVEASDPKIVATRIRKANAAAKRKADKNRELEGAGGSEGSSKRRKEKGDNVISPTQTQGDNLLEIPAHDSANTTTRLYEEHHDEHSGVLGNRDGNFDDDVDEEIDLEGPDRHVSDTLFGSDGAESSLLHLFLFVLEESTEEPSDHFPEESVIFDGQPYSSGAHTAYGHLSLFMTPPRHQALHEESLETTPRRVLSCCLGRKGSLMATNAEQALRIKELEQKLKSVDEVHSSAMKDLESPLAQKDSALVYAERISGKCSKAGFSEELVFAPKLVRAAEVARSKDTTSKEFSRSKTGPSLQDPASKHASGGSKAPPSKKT
ncbi:hypothetical protein Tco_0487838 [Tanacetum coccineum]